MHGEQANALQPERGYKAFSPALLAVDENHHRQALILCDDEACSCTIAKNNDVA